MIPVQPQIIDLIAYVIKNRDRGVTRDDLIENVWNGRIVSESTLATRINAARKSLGDNGTDQRLIRAVHGRGIRFVGTLTTPPDTDANPKNSRSQIEYVDLDLANIVGAAASPALATLSTGLFELSTVGFSGRVYYSLKLDTLPTSSNRTGYSISSKIRQIGDRASYSIELSNLDSSRLLWAKTFDIGSAKPFENLSLTAEIIINQIPSIIADDRTREAAGQNAKTSDAMDLFCRGRHLSRTKTPKTVLRQKNCSCNP